MDIALRLSRSQNKMKPEQDLAIRVWSELGIIEQGNIAIGRRLHSLLSQASIAERFDRAVAAARRLETDRHAENGASG